MNALLLKNIHLVLGVIIFSGMAAVLETISLAVVVPLLIATPHNFGVKLPFPFDQFMAFFEHMELGPKLQMIAIFLMVGALIKNAFVYGNTLCSSSLRSAIVRHYRMQCMQKALKVEMSYLNRRRASDIQQIIENNTDVFIGGAIDSIMSIQPFMFTLILLVMVLFSLSVKLTFISLGLAGVTTLLMGFIFKKMRQSGGNYAQEMTSFKQVLMDILHGMKILRLFGREEVMLKAYENKVDSFNAAYARMTRSTFMVAPVFEICGIFILAAILLVGSVLVVKTPSTYQILLIFILIWVRIIPPVKSFNQTRAMVIARLPGIKEVHAFLKQTHEETMVNGSKNFDTFENSIEFRNLSFRYNVQAPYVLQDFALTVKKGMRVGIVGASGAGKSTISEILLRFYDIQQGGIFIDGDNLKDLDIVSWRKAVGVVTQDTFLFHDTVYANIAFANPQADEAMVMQAARRAYAHNFIKDLPQGYQTKIGDRGVMLSGGQRQRIAIARAILNEPQVLILDEATSALDSESEQYVQKALEEISRDKTVIAIAHRLSTVVDSDHIVVLDKGRIVEQGHPKQLMATDGHLKKLMALQGIGEDIVKVDQS